MPFLQQLLTIAASQPYGSIIRTHQQYLIITNQYRFFWNILPKLTKRFVSKHKFIKQMRKYNFVEVNNITNLVFETNQQQDKIVILSGPERFVQLISSVIQIRNKGSEQKQNLMIKADKIKQLIQQQTTKDPSCMMKGFQLLQVISSLSQINRKVLALQNQVKQIVNSISLSQLNHLQDSQNLLVFESSKSISKKKLRLFYTCNNFTT